MPYDLEERTSRFGENVIILCSRLTQDTVSRPIISQLIRSSTSIGANYREANGASSRKDFRNKIFICKKEAQETEYWLRMMTACYPQHHADVSALGKESHEITLIFQKITSTLSA
jgi:four helix bundle protein